MRLRALGVGAALFVSLSTPLRAAVCTGISTASGSPLTTVLFASGIPRPLFVTAPPDDTTRVFILEQDGRIRVVRNGELLITPFLDITALVASPDNGGQEEQGLLGLAFHPKFGTNGYLYVYYTSLAGGVNVVARYTRSTIDPDLADPNSGVEILSIPHPRPFHNGGTLAFGPADGYLYVSCGDDGDYCDRIGNAQNGANDMGKILRIDVDHLPNIIPATNPFVGPDGINDEIWALGLRNPWRFSIDSLTSDLYITDVGQAQREEVDFQPASSPGGENYGWNLYEGFDCPNPSCGSSACSVPDYAPPILDYDHSNGACAITGGYVYRGCRMPDLHGTYFYGDFCSAFIGSFRVVSGQVTEGLDRTAELAPGGGLGIEWITSFGTDARGEIYIVDGGLSTANIGEIYKIVPVLSNLEVSGLGAKPFSVSGSQWTWENLRGSSSHPIAQYRVRRAGARTGPFQCIHATSTASWSGGDPAAPALKSAYYYLVTAVNASGVETSPGTASNGAPRNLSGAPCPP